MIPETKLLELPFEDIEIDVTLNYNRTPYDHDRALLHLNGFSCLENLFAAVIYKSMREYLGAVPRSNLSFKFTELPTLKGFDELNLRIEGMYYHQITGDFTQLRLSNISELKLGTICGSGIFSMPRPMTPANF